VVWLTDRWSATVERRLKALKKLEYEAIKRTVDYYVELHALETKYQELLAPLDQRVQLFSSLVSLHKIQLQYPLLVWLGG